MKYKAIISDIDGTLVKNNSFDPPSAKVLDAISKAAEKGVTFVMATARPIEKVKHLLDIFPTDGYIILDNGASIYEIKNKKLVWESLIERNVAEKIFTIAQKHEQLGGIGLSTREGRIIDIKELPQHVHIRRINVKGLDAEQSRILREELESLEENITVVTPLSSIANHLFDVFITNANASKQHAVVKISDMLNIPTHQMIGIGDHYNDFALLMACGFKVAMGNAISELKEIADYIAPPVDEDGVADVIERFIIQG